jgi:hypothetical protein
MTGYEGGSTEIEVIAQPQIIERPVQSAINNVEQAPAPAKDQHIENLRARNTFEPQFRGFSENQQNSVKNIADSVGFYRAGIKSFVHGGTRHIPGGEVGGWFDFGRKELALADGALRHEGQMGSVTIHELTHAGSPFVNKEARDYYIATKGYELFNEATMGVVKAAQQSFVTGTYLNGYHKWLGNQLKFNQIDPAQFIEETSAILAEIRITNPMHLQQVNEAQTNKLLRNGVHPNQITDLVKASNLQMNLMMDGLDTHDHKYIEAHLEQVRGGIKAGVNKFYEGSNRRNENLTQRRAAPSFGTGKTLPEPQVIDMETAIIKALKAPRKKPFVIEEPNKGFIWSLLELLELLLLANTLDTTNIGRIAPINQIQVLPGGRIVVEG